MPGTGTIDWEEAFAALAEIGFAGDLVIESFVTLPPEIAAALCVWRPVARDRYEVLDAGRVVSAPAGAEASPDRLTWPASSASTSAPRRSRR